MSLPTLIKLTGSFVTASGALGDDPVPQTGTVTIKSSNTLQRTSDNSTAGPFFFEKELDVTGYFEVDVPATDDPAWLPTGWTYLIKEYLSGGVRTYRITVPIASVGGTLDLADVSPIVSAPDPAAYILSSEKGAPLGVATLDSGGQVPAGQLPVTGGGIPASIVDVKGDLIAASAANTVVRVPVGTDAQVLRADSAVSPGVSWHTLTAADVGASGSGHNHDGSYSGTAHNHDGTYSGAGHNHDGTYATAVHTHAIANVTGLQTTLDGKVDESVVSAKGDLYVATGSAAVTRLAVGTNTHVLTADSAEPSGIKWAAAAGGGGGGGLLGVYERAITSGNITAPNSPSTWVILSTLGITIPSGEINVDDYVELSWDMMHNLTGSNFLDWAVIVGSSITRACSSKSATPNNEGLVSLYPGAASFSTMPKPFGFKVESGHLDSGALTFNMISKASGSGTIFATSLYVMQLTVKNFGDVPVTTIA